MIRLIHIIQLYLLKYILNECTVQFTFSIGKIKEYKTRGPRWSDRTLSAKGRGRGCPEADQLNL